MTSLALPLAASLIASAVCAVIVRGHVKRNELQARATPALGVQRAALWRNALSATLLLSMASGVALLAPADISPSDRLTECLCLAAGLAFLVRLAVLLRRLGSAGFPGAVSARKVMLTGPAGPVAAAWAMLRSPLEPQAALPAGVPAQVHLQGCASASLRSDSAESAEAVSDALLSPIPALLLCALFPPVHRAGELGWALLTHLPQGAELALGALALEMATIVGLAALHSARRKV